MEVSKKALDVYVYKPYAAKHRVKTDKRVREVAAAERDVLTYCEYIKKQCLL